MASLKDITVSLFRERHTTAEIREKTREFNLSTNCITSMFLFELGYIETGPFQKIIIEIKQNPDYNYQDDMGDVLRIEARLDIQKYLISQEIERKKIILELINQRFLWLFEKRGWDTAKVVKALANCLEKDIQFIWAIGKKKSNPSRKYNAQLEINYGMAVAIIQVRITNRHDENNEQVTELCSTEPHEFKMVPVLGKTKWTSKDEFTLWSKDKTKHWSVKVSKDFIRKCPTKKLCRRK